MNAEVQSAGSMARKGIRARTVAVAVLALIISSIAVVFWRTTISMIDTWQHSSTYGHCYLVVPLALWMAWRQSPASMSWPFEPQWRGLAIVAACGFVWLIGELANAAVISQFALIALVSATVWTVLGSFWTRQWAFPLVFLLFAVPFGEGLLPMLMEWTADVTVGALRVSGIPVYREGNYFVVPSGNWSVIEACGGVRFLIAALMTGCIFAWVQFRTANKRIAFILASVAVALVANWLRAYAIVLLGHVSNNRIGTGADHNVWGWLIFGMAMFALFALGMRWSDPLIAPVTQRRDSDSNSIVSTGVVFRVWIASLMTVAVWPVTAARIEQRIDTRPVQIESIDQRADWQLVTPEAADWVPELAAPSAVTIQSFVHSNRRVNVFLGLYRNQRQGAEVISALNQVAGSDNKRWRVLERGSTEVSLNGKSTVVETAVVNGVDGKFLIWHWYWAGGRATASDLTVTAQLALQRLTGQPDDAAWVALSTPIAEDVRGGERHLREFADTMSASIDRALQVTAAR